MTELEDLYDKMGFNERWEVEFPYTEACCYGLGIGEYFQSGYEVHWYKSNYDRVAAMLKDEKIWRLQN